MNVVITGGSSGIGKATARLFASRGHKVFELSRHGKDADGVRHVDCDVTRKADCHLAISRITDEVGGIDVLICNAGIGISGAVEFTDEADFRRQFDVNFFGAVNITQSVLPHMRRQKGGRIIFVSSMAAVFAIPFQSFYSATKSALNAFALALRNEMRPFGVTVTCLLPGDVRTGFTDSRAKSVAGAEVYGNMEKAVATMERDERGGIAPERMARRLLTMAETSSPNAFYTVGWNYKLFLLLNKLLPATLANRVVGLMY